jgi:glycosyltransferase involved in cell wall biosynthesis
MITPPDFSKKEPEENGLNANLQNNRTKNVKNTYERMLMTIEKEFPLVSIVTPVYNGEKFLAEAIDSILTQTYPNWEYTIVENCSTDRTLEIAQSYAREDKRIRIYQNSELLPIIDNHNLAMRQISEKSSYCKVLHADDLLFPECIAAMVKVAEAYPSIGIVGSYRLSGDCVVPDGIPYNVQILTGRDVCRKSLMKRGFYVFGSPSSLLIRSDLVRCRDPFYSSHMFADVGACYNVLEESDFGFVHQVLTLTRLHDNSVTKAHQDLGRTLLGQLTVLKKYGFVYLNQQEYEVCLDKRLEDYYRFLGKKFLLFRENEFWVYQDDWLKSIGLSINRKRLVSSILKLIFANITRPKEIREVYRDRFL